MLRTAMLHANASFASVRALVRLHTGEFLNALRLNDEIRRGVPRKRSTSSNHTSLTLVFLGRFPMRPVTQSASSYGLASWTGQYFPACSTRVCFGTSHPHSSVTIIIEPAKMMVLNLSVLPYEKHPSVRLPTGALCVRTEKAYGSKRQNPNVLFSRKSLYFLGKTGIIGINFCKKEVRR